MGERVALIDTETTGFPQDPDARVVELGVAIFDLDCWDPVLTFSSFIKPDVLTEEGREVVSCISGIDPDILEMAPPPHVVEGWARAVIGDLPILAFNMGFDRPMTLRSLHLEDLFSRPRPVGPMLAPWRFESNCVLEAFTEVFSVMTRTHEDGAPRLFSLARAADLADVKFEGQPHRALTDAIVAGRVLLRLEEGLRPPEPVFVPKLRLVSESEAPVLRREDTPDAPSVRVSEEVMAPVLRVVPRPKVEPVVVLPKIRVGRVS
jgi:DNA polymerase III epsilon subunit-like protein